MGQGLAELWWHVLDVWPTVKTHHTGTTSTTRTRGPSPRRTRRHSPPHPQGKGCRDSIARDLEAAVTDPTTVIRDPAGRYLAVRCKIHSRDTMFIGAHADNKNNARQEAYYSHLYAALPPYNPSTNYHLFIDANNASDWTLDRRGTLPLNRTTFVGLPHSGAY